MTDLETTMKALAANWQSILDTMSEGRSEGERGALVETMMLVAHANHGQLYGSTTTAASLEVTARTLRDADRTRQAAENRPAAEVIPIAARRH